MEIFEKYKSQFKKYEVDTNLRIIHWMTQVASESNFKAVRESLYYRTIEGLKENFKSPFRGKSNDFVKQYLRNSEKCANYVYANRMGNGNEFSGDGYNFRGGGFLQNTGEDQYKSLSISTGIDFIKNPDLILEEPNAVIAALYFWKKNNLNHFADKDDLDGVSDKINIGRKTQKYGDANGFKDRLENYNHYKKIILK
jgi:putative chitinase